MPENHQDDRREEFLEKIKDILKKGAEEEVSKKD